MANANDSSEISLSDKYVELLETSLKENAELRKVIQQRDKQQQDVLRRLEEHLSVETSTKETRKRKRSVVDVPQLCKQQFRDMFKTLMEDKENFEGFNLDERRQSTINQKVTMQVLEAVQQDHGGPVKCSWSPVQLKGAAKIYYKSLHDAKIRRERGKDAKHALTCRRQGRQRDKLQRRLKAIEKAQWNSDKKVAVREAMVPECVSSDESDWTDTEAGPIVKAYLAKKLSWERPRLTKYKQELDKLYYSNLPARTRSSLIIRKRHSVQSSRARPTVFLSWAVQPMPTSTPSRKKTPAVDSLNLSPVF